MKEQKIILVESDQIAEHPRQQEIYSKITLDAEFLASIEEKGIIQPILITPANELWPELKEEYVVIAGHRRLAAAKLLGIDQVPAYIKEYDNIEDSFTDLLLSNLHRKKTDKEIVKEIKHFKKMLNNIKFIKQKYGSKSIYDKENLKSKNNKDANNAVPQSAENSENEEIFFKSEFSEIIEQVGDGFDVAKLIAEKTGMPERRIEQLIAVMDDDYLDKALNQLYDKGLSVAEGDTIYAKWLSIRELFEAGELSLNSAYGTVLELKKNALKKEKKDKKVMSKPVAYISGSISNNPIYIDQFEEAERHFSSEFQLINPIGFEIEKTGDDNLDWIKYMTEQAIPALLGGNCSTIIMLEGWENSRGAAVEHAIAQCLDYKVLYYGKV